MNKMILGIALAVLGVGIICDRQKIEAPMIVLNRGHAVLIKDDLAITAKHLVQYNTDVINVNTIIYEDSALDIVVYTRTFRNPKEVQDYTNAISFKRQASKVELSGIISNNGDSGKGVYRGNTLVGIIVGYSPSSGTTVVSEIPIKVKEIYKR